MAQDVNDKPTERGIFWNNVLTAVTVGLLGWVALSIENIKDTMSEYAKNAAVAEVRQAGLKDDLDRLRDRVDQLDQLDGHRRQ